MAAVSLANVRTQLALDKRMVSTAATRKPAEGTEVARDAIRMIGEQVRHGFAGARAGA
jgi:hypothetical protein